MTLCLLALSTCKGPAGPPGLLRNGKVAGQITVWEDAVSNSQNSPAAIPAGGFTVSVTGDSTKTATTAADGKYELPSVPAGTYIVVTSKDSSSASGYGTMRRYNVVIGGGTSYYSGEIGRKAPKPTPVSAIRDSLATTGGGKIAAIRVAWNIAPVSIQFTTYAFIITFQAPTAGFTLGPFLGSGALSDTTFVIGLPPGQYNVAVQSDIGLSYIDQSTGTEVFPTRSSQTAAPNSVTLTRPVRPVAAIPARALAREFPGKRVLQAVVKDR
ncbi:MAG: carboxypeptidase regulatory-like domain-containing protein [Candidatus Latescibacteria bacterium]|nr:carboxypeptidase regulatory-like domain-containing protein [Candidatus Latescibacterota bacterium]